MDVVADAYLGVVNSQQLVQDTRARMHWLLDVIGSGTVLDIGCSQGILALLLARRGDTQVTGIDVLDAAIANANMRLRTEPQMVQKSVTFTQVDFLNDDITAYQGCFDTVVVGQVLEHISDPNAFLTRAASCLGAPRADCSHSALRRMGSR